MTANLWFADAEMNGEPNWRVSFLMNIDCRTIARREPRFEVRMPVMVSGMGKDGHFFSRAAQTLNGSTEGMGLLLDQGVIP